MSDLERHIAVVKICLLKRHGGVVSPNPCECDFILEKVFFRSNQVKMWSYFNEQVLIWYNWWCPYRGTCPIKTEIHGVF